MQVLTVASGFTGQNAGTNQGAADDVTDVEFEEVSGDKK
jgi:hypothetical protein